MTKPLPAFALAAALLPASAAHAGPVDPAKVQEAIKRGADFLKGANTKQASIDGNAVGLSALAGLALMEAGVPHTDPALSEIIQFLRVHGGGLTKTYEMALAVIFLDRLNDPADVPMIQLIGCRLLAGQNAVGGWTYTCWAGTDDAAVQAAVGVKDPKLIRPQPRPDPNAPPPAPPKLHAEAEKVYRAVRSGLRTGTGTGDDNSNTQFAIVGLWVAQRRGVPCGAAFRAIDARFMRTQSSSDHGWGYNNEGGAGSTPSMTCAGLLGLAVAAAHETGKLPTDRGDVASNQQKKPMDDDPFFNPPDGKAGGGDPDAPKAEEEEEVKKKGNPIRNAAIERALRALGRLLKANPGGAGAPGAGGGGWGGVSDLYFYWSLERVAVGYGLETVGDVDWYAWGVDRILPGQQQTGAWNGNHGEIPATAFAILFLARSNFVSDLTRNIRGKVKDPGEAVLRGAKNSLNSGGSTEAVRTPGAGGAAAGPDQPGLAQVTEQPPDERISEGLVRATDSKWPGLLRNARDNKGGEFTIGLARAVTILDGKRQYQAREALVDRLTRMSAESLKAYLSDRNPELRRGACLAWAMKDDKAAVRELIDMISDVDESVVKAARAGLKSLTGEDYGPPSGATDDQKSKSVEKWLIWYSTSGRGR